MTIILGGHIKCVPQVRCVKYCHMLHPSFLNVELSKLRKCSVVPAHEIILCIVLIKGFVYVFFTVSQFLRRL
jgi:hypothetical protein